jgi:hypothetical protein
MTTFNVLPPFPVFFGRDGKPLEAGFVFIGELNQNPEDEEQEKAIFWDAALTIPAAQPVRTIGGYPSRAGSPSQVFVDGKFSLTVRDKNMQMVYTVGDAAALNPDAILTAADVVLAEAAAAIAVAAAVDAETAKDGAETAETNAAASAAAAATSETNAETAEDNAAASAAAALVSEGNAAASETATEALFEDFDTRYLGAKASAPTLDNEGNALQTGAVYFNSTSDTLFVWDGAAWSPAVFDTAGALFAVNNLSDVANAATSRANIGLQYASEAEAEAGTSNIRAMTPLRTADAIAAQRPVSANADFTADTTSLATRGTIKTFVDGAIISGTGLKFLASVPVGTGPTVLITGLPTGRPLLFVFNYFKSSATTTASLNVRSSEDGGASFLSTPISITGSTNWFSASNVVGTMTYSPVGGGLVESNIARISVAGAAGTVQDTLGLGQQSRGGVLAFSSAINAVEFSWSAPGLNFAPGVGIGPDASSILVYEVV